MKAKQEPRVYSPRQAQALRKGDRVRMIAPGSPVDPQKFQAGVQWLREWGFRVTFDRGILTKTDYLAGNDDRRLSELLRALQDPEAHAVLAARGGYGTMRLLGRLSDLGRIPSKVVMGLSDLTALLNHVAFRHGLVTVHGAMVAGDSFGRLPEKDRTRLFSLLETGDSVTLRATKDHEVWRPGNAKGRLWGGNLTLISCLIGTPFAVPDNGILFIEEVHEPLFRVDRLLCHLALAGVFQRVTGVVVGQMLAPKVGRLPDESIRDLILHYVGSRKIPVLGGLEAGHDMNLHWLPIGGKCEIGSSGRVLTLAPLVAA